MIMSYALCYWVHKVPKFWRFVKTCRAWCGPGGMGITLGQPLSARRPGWNAVQERQGADRSRRQSGDQCLACSWGAA